MVMSGAKTPPTNPGDAAVLESSTQCRRAHPCFRAEPTTVAITMCAHILESGVVGRYVATAIPSPLLRRSDEGNCGRS